MMPNYASMTDEELRREAASATDDCDDCRLLAEIVKRWDRDHLDASKLRGNWYPIGKLNPDNSLDQAFVKAWNDASTKGDHPS